MGCSKSSKIVPIANKKEKIRNLYVAVDKLLEDIEKDQSARGSVQELKRFDERSSDRQTMIKTYKVRTLLNEINEEKRTPETGTSNKMGGHLKKTLEREEGKCKGKEEKLISNFKFCFDEGTGKALGFEET